MYTKLFFIGLIILVIFLIYLNYETTKKLNNIAIEFNKLKSENDLLHKSNIQLQYIPPNDSNNINFICNNDICHIDHEPNKINNDTNNFIFNNDNNNINFNKYHDSEFNVILNDLDDNNEYETESEIQQTNKNTNKNNLESDSDSDSELIFNTGNSLCYTTKVDTETKKILQTLKNDITDTETIKFATEDINSKTNPFASTIVSCLLNNILNKQHSDTPAATPLQPVNSIETNDLDIFNNANSEKDSLIESLSNKALDENHVQVSIDQCNNIEREINKLNDNTQIDTNLLFQMKEDYLLNNDSGVITPPKGASCNLIQTTIVEPIKENKNTYTYDKLNKLKIDEIKLLCINKKIKLSVNKKQKKKDELIKELLTL